MNKTTVRLKDKYEQVLSERDKYKAALEDIKRHQEVVGGHCVARVSGTWNIANKALGGNDD